MKNNLKEKQFVEFLSEKEICELHEAFNMFDIDSDGSIELSQLRILMNSLKQYTKNKEELIQILKEEHIYNTNQIYFNQFLKIMAKRIKHRKNDEDKYLKSCFLSLDRNKNGYISLHEIRYIITHYNEEITEEEIKDLMEEADTDKDGYVSFDEFMTIMKD